MYQTPANPRMIPMWYEDKRAAVIGIDPGLKGGIAIIPVHNVRATMAHLMPTVSIPKSSKRDIDWEELGRLVRPWVGPVYVERVHAMPKQGVTSTFKFGMGFGGILGVAGAYERRVVQLTPQFWKKRVLSAYEERDKAAAIDYAQKTFPGVSLTPGKTRTPQDGLADALCIARLGLTLEDI